ncbi:hypothetical protein [Rugosimonospora africana]|uniref:Uncharacterized protein n=1 Tax=Rugosimonospora africana TaxID=556532 RepID=A0A8J3QU36_9ACTN|nr:hypothetical protein [Rugosimonospora africana]GIH15728.1 hypothetical protein Raf01_39000 [Rugosimonospora africana]
MTDWATIAELGTAFGTLVLAVATFASVRSGNRAARIAELSLMSRLRPLVLPSRVQDPEQKVGFQDDHWVRVPGGHAHAEATEDAIYLVIPLRNVGEGLAVLNGWAWRPGRISGVERPDPDDVRRLTRDLYIAPHDLGFWQGAFRDPTEQIFDDAAKAILGREAFTIDVLYSDGEGGQRIITRFTVIPVGGENWLASVSRHWNLDRADPR